MGAKAKLETLTNTWYGFTLFSAVVGLLSNGIGLWSIFWSVVSLGFSLAWVWFLGNRLQNKSRFWRFFLIVASGLMTGLSVVGAAKATWMFVHVWELKLIAAAAISAIYGWVMAKSFRTLTDSSVKAYFNA